MKSIVIIKEGSAALELFAENEFEKSLIENASDEAKTKCEVEFRFEKNYYNKENHKIVIRINTDNGL